MGTKVILTSTIDYKRPAYVIQIPTRIPETLIPETLIPEFTAIPEQRPTKEVFTY